MNITSFLGRDINELLSSSPFNNWQYELSKEDDLLESIAYYVFTQDGLEIQCDPNNIIKTIFLYSKEYGGYELSGMSFTFDMTRDQIRGTFGIPERAGEESNDDILGFHGCWDRYKLSGYYIHFSFVKGACGIDQVTLISGEDAP